MKHSSSSCRGRCAGVGHFVLGLAHASLAAACSGHYPLGETSDSPGLLGDGAPVPRGQAGDARVAASLAPPDVTIDAEGDGGGPGALASVGDLDGDGRADMAIASSDFTSGLAFVHLRYGGLRPHDTLEAFAFEQSGARLILGDGAGETLFVGGAGDVDGDGYDELLLEISECNAPWHDAGTYLIYGGPERLQGVLPITQLAAHFEPPLRELPADLGTPSCVQSPRATGPGDLDGDGFDDLAIASAPLLDRYGSPEPGTRRDMYLFYGQRQRFAGNVPFAAADASFPISLTANAYPLGDVNGDGLADLVVGPDVYTPEPSGSFLLSGRAERWSGAIELAASGTLLEGAFVDTNNRVHSHGDIDGDGLDDVLLRTGDGTRHLFYGAPDLFAGGLDFARSDATFGGLASDVYAVGDRDGDGDDELLDQFYDPDMPQPMQSVTANVALSSGSHERLSGSVIFPESEVIAQLSEDAPPGSRSPLRTPGRALEFAIPAGDLDGDGAADLFTTSFGYQIMGPGTYQKDTPQVHIHYGRPAPQTTSLR